MPEVQLVHSLDPAEENVPAEQLEHADDTDAPTFDEKVPTLQLKQVADPRFGW